MAQLELTYQQMFPEDGDPGWHAGQLPDGRRVHAAAILCQPGNLHWAGSVEDSNACECEKAGTCNLCLIRQDGGLVFTRVTGCYRSANSAVRALQHWAANPDGPQPPAPFDCGWTTIQAVLRDNVPGAPPMPLGTTEHPVLSSQDHAEPPEFGYEDPIRTNEVLGNTWKLAAMDGDHNEFAPPDGFEFTVQAGEELTTAWFRQIAMQQITPESLDECSDMGHPRQAWLILSEQQEDAVTCPACGRTPEFHEKMSSDNVGFAFDYISEILNETHMATHEIFRDHDAEELTFTFESDVFEDAKEWPKPGSTHLTRLPFPGEHALTLRWLRDEWNQRDDGHLGEHEVLLDPYSNEPLTDVTLRELLAECRENGFSYEDSATDIVKVTRGIPLFSDDDDDDDYDDDC